MGFAGLVGSGRTEIMRALFGVDKIHSGDIYLNKTIFVPHDPKDSLKSGIALCPEDRKEQGILPNISVKGNITISILKRFANKLGIISSEKEYETAHKNIKRFRIKTPDADKLIAQLSGGNQQKAILARSLETNPHVLILDEPTKGIDIGAKSEFYKIICECAKSGMAVIVISSELPEVIGLCDRIIVVRDGKISGEVMRENATEVNILKFAMV